MNVEFIGLPGVGKSWVCASLEGALREADAADRFRFFHPLDSGWRPRVIASKLIRSTQFAARHPLRALQLVRLVSGSGQVSTLQAVAKTANLFSEMGKALGCRQGTVGLMEQGVLQAVWSLAFRAQKLDLEKILTVARPCLPQIVAHLEAGPNEVGSRLDHRKEGRSHFDTIPPDQREAAFSRGEILFEEVVKTWRRLRPGSVYLAGENSVPGDVVALESEILAAVTFLSCSNLTSGKTVGSSHAPA